MLQCVYSIPTHSLLVLGAVILLPMLQLHAIWRQKTKTALLACWYKAALVGGVHSRFLRLWVNNICCASLTVVHEQFLLYICTINHSMRRIWTVLSSSGWCIKVTTVSVTSGQCSHAFHAVFFPIPNMLDIKSPPVNAWKNGRARHLFGPSCALTSCTGMAL